MVIELSQEPSPAFPLLLAPEPWHARTVVAGSTDGGRGAAARRWVLCLDGGETAIHAELVFEDDAGVASVINRGASGVSSCR